MVLSTLFFKLFVLCMPSNAAEAARIDYDERSKKKIHGGGWWGCPDINNNNMKKEGELLFFTN